MTHHILNNHLFIGDLPDGGNLQGCIYHYIFWHKDVLSDNYTIIGLASDLTKADWERVVDKGRLGYRDYTAREYFIHNSSLSALSFLHRHNLTPSKTVVLKIDTI